MNKPLKIGLWIPPRLNQNETVDVDNPSNIDSAICDLFEAYLDKPGIICHDDLDFRKATIKNHQAFIGDFCLNDLDHFIWMADIERHLGSYHLEVLRAIELSANVHNSHSFYSVATDKFSAFSILHRHGIPVSDLYLVNSTNVHALEPLFEHDSFLLKPRRGGWGIGIIKVDDFSQLRDIVEYHAQDAYYVEKFYPNDLSEWVGVSVVNGTLIYGFRKTSGKISGWKVYDKEKTGGQVTYVKPCKEIEIIALKIGEILGANYYGLDFIKTTDGYKVVDINCHPGIYRELIDELNIPIAKLFFGMLPIHES